MDKTQTVLKVKPLITAFLEKGGYILVDLRFYRNQARGWILELLIDRQGGGITLDECAGLNREIGDFLEGSGLREEPYALDVSSPGLDRPLVTSADFLRVKGKKIKVFLREAVEGKIEHWGVIESIDQEGFVLTQENKKEQKTIRVPLNKVNKAKQVIL